MSIHAIAWYKDPRDVIVRPIVSEKSYTLIDQGKYTFEVDPRATKTEIKLAIETLFKGQVTSVNTLISKGKLKRFRGRPGRRGDVKKAIVTLAEGQSIDVTTGL